MSRVITFSRTFPKGHFKEDKPTYFVEKIWASLLPNNPEIADYIYEVSKLLGEYMSADEILLAIAKFKPKQHTIRSGHRWKSGDKFSPRIWSKNPYQSKQIIIAPDIKIVRTVDFEIKVDLQKNMYFYINGTEFNNIDELSQNDGLDYIDFTNWFKLHPKGLPFDGQIIIFNENNLACY